MSNRIERMWNEYEGLSLRTNRLREFVFNNPTFDTLPRAEQYDLQEQLSAMERYNYILSRRVQRAEGVI